MRPRLRISAAPPPDHLLCLKPPCVSHGELAELLRNSGGSRGRRPSTVREVFHVLLADWQVRASVLAEPDAKLDGVCDVICASGMGCGFDHIINV